MHRFYILSMDLRLLLLMLVPLYQLQIRLELPADGMYLQVVQVEILPILWRNLQIKILEV